MWFTRHALFLALERFKEEGFISLSNADQTLSLLRIGQRKKTMTPEKRGVAMYFANFRAIAHTGPIGHLLRIFQPLILVAQPGQRCAGQGIEGGATGRAAVTLQSRCRAPARNVIMTALGTQRLALHATFNQRTDSLNVLNLIDWYDDSIDHYLTVT